MKLPEVVGRSQKRGYKAFKLYKVLSEVVAVKALAIIPECFWRLKRFLKGFQETLIKF